MGILRLVLSVTLPLYVIDQVTKWWIVFNFPAPVPGAFSSTKSIVVADGFARGLPQSLRHAAPTTPLRQPKR